MTLFIACLIIYALKLSGWWYFAAIVVWGINCCIYYLFWEETLKNILRQFVKRNCP